MSKSKGDLDTDLYNFCNLNADAEWCNNLWGKYTVVAAVDIKAQIIASLRLNGA